MQFGYRRKIALAATLTACALGGVHAATAASAFPPKANAAWVYDPKDANGEVLAGTYVDAINQYNLTANAGHRVSEIYSYGGDMEMYCPGGVAANCTASDLYVFFSRDAVVNDSLPAKHRNASAVAYAKGLDQNLLGGAPIVVPIIDGAVTGKGALGGFNDLSPSMARAFADKVAWRLCSDPTVAGVEFDLEPFNVNTANGQYYFYKRIARNFASTQMHCVDATHPKGRFFGIFASSNALRPGTDSSVRVAEILNRRHNGYWIDPLYDLAGDPSGYRTSVDKYRSMATAHAYNTARWAKALGVKYQFGIPSAASFHEYTDCSGSACGGAAAPAQGQLDYVTAAREAIDASYARDDSLFLGTALWSWSPRVGFGDTSFGPTAPDGPVVQYLGGTM